MRAEYSGFRNGTTQCGVRWNTRNRSTLSASSPRIWTPVEPVPIIASRLSDKGTLWSHRAEWKQGPANESSPGMSGYAGWCRIPVAEITKSYSAVVPSVALTCQLVPVHRASVTSVANLTRSVTPASSETFSK